ncbi:hypothetical protein KJ840_00350 [Patescibacteria group bacterium]|nr:hypothetical protein [Patescibacteria group bacterium]
MKFNIQKTQLQKNLRDALRRAGYFSISDRKSGQLSYVKRLSKTQHYPRFHLYFTEDQDSYTFNLHLDQKKPSYAGQHAHSGEYDEPLVKEEAERIQSII